MFGKKYVIVCVILFCTGLFSSLLWAETNTEEPLGAVLSVQESLKSENSGIGVLTLKNAIDCAMEKSFSIKTAKNNLEKELNNSHVKTYLPTLSLSGAVSESADLLGDPGNDLKYPTIRLSTGITWRFGTNDFLKKTSSSVNIKSAELNLEREVNQVYEDVSTSYYHLILLKEQVKQSDDALKTAKANYDKTNAMYMGSKATRLSLLQAEITYNDNVINYDNALTVFNNALVDFRILTGIEDDFDLPSAPDVTGLFFDRLEGLAEENYEKNISIRKAEADLQLSKINKTNAIVENRVPSITLNTGLNYEFLKVRNYDFDPSLDLTGSVTVSIPLDSYLPWTQANANVKNADINVNNAKISLDSVRDSLRNNIRSCINQIRSYVNKIDNLNLHLTLAEQNYNETQSAYEKGYLPFSDLNTAKSSLDTARRNVTNNNASIIAYLCVFASLLELNTDYVFAYLS